MKEVSCNVKAVLVASVYVRVMCSSFVVGEDCVPRIFWCDLTVFLLVLKNIAHLEKRVMWDWRNEGLLLAYQQHVGSGEAYKYR